MLVKMHNFCTGSAWSSCYFSARKWVVAIENKVLLLFSKPEALVCSQSQTLTA